MTRVSLAAKRGDAESPARRALAPRFIPALSTFSPFLHFSVGDHFPYLHPGGLAARHIGVIW